MRFTVFTPTYNRAYCIKELYESLKRQSFLDFEWIVVDDGSTDETEQLFEEIQSECKLFPVKYIKTKNGGKHRAINLGVSEASGKLFFIVDSDDYLTDDALQRADYVEKTIDSDIKHEFAGVCGLKGYDNDTEIGSSFQGNYLDITQLERSKYNITGDKSEIFYTAILKEYPFPEFESEKFVTECVVWDKIANDGYKLRFYNDVSVICEYRPDGLTSQGQSLFLKNPKGYGLYVYQCGKYGKTKGLEKWSQYLKYFYEFRENMSFRDIARNLHANPIYLWLRLFGMRLFYKLYDN